MNNYDNDDDVTIKSYDMDDKIGDYNVTKYETTRITTTTTMTTTFTMIAITNMTMVMVMMMNELIVRMEMV